jgi:hypothetical protein
MEFVFECIPRSHYTLYMRLGLTERRDKASCLIGIGQRDSLSLKKDALIKMVIFN